MDVYPTLVGSAKRLENADTAGGKLVTRLDTIVETIVDIVHATPPATGRLVPPAGWHAGASRSALVAPAPLAVFVL